MAGRCAVGVQHRVQLGREQRALAERGAGDLGVLGRHEVRVRAAGTVAPRVRMSGSGTLSMRHGLSELGELTSDSACIGNPWVADRPQSSQGRGPFALCPGREGEVPTREAVVFGCSWMTAWGMVGVDRD